jgi:hypothetical protein
MEEVKDTKEVKEVKERKIAGTAMGSKLFSFTSLAS